MDAVEIEELIARGIPGAHVEVRDYTGGGDHFEALVVSDLFEGKGLVERHQLVYKALSEAMRVKVHALTLKALTPAQHQAQK
jgi:acid stress-induced BolA-like protein IbaG/YrbA